MNAKPNVISIAAVSGGGKTTITNQLLGKLNNSKALYFDEYDFKDCPDDICDWVSRGADYNEWNLAPLIKDIQVHLNNKSLKYILLDYPFAYLNNAISGYIDLTVFIDTPLDIAMARRILRDYSENSMNDVKSDLNNYLFRGRDAYLEMQRNVKPNSDFVIEGLLPVPLIVDHFLKELSHRSL
ncbi:hypothetical protein BC351_29215 [Paenibacillus ferrarius]|uniref:Phosphoribulokinase/uridine kinase domain-containing protein n=1 Tax=Paenibacillus ferrarius TaxID=1469647 RepID=A0A1V4HHH9_9BACL|nr:hypothetical protein [Paenibacillus ferrarius]OPH55977.1 hypothetical protein BC351_29215 [Paenibacillus ferrarius]